MNVGDRLREARRKKGFTQDSLASSIGVSRGVITNIEHGKTIPQSLVIHAICNALSINEEWLLQGIGKMEGLSDTQKQSFILSEIYESAKLLSTEEQEYILNMIKTFQKFKKETDHK